MKQGRSSFARRSAARLAAVQALYQMEMSEASAEAALEELARRAKEPDASADALVEPDRNFLGELVRGVDARRQDIDRMLGAALSSDWPLERLEAVLRAILRAGVWELLSRPDIDAAVVITEYVRIGEAFFDGGEPKLVNGVLDRLARTLRETEGSAPAEDGHAR